MTRVMYSVIQSCILIAVILLTATVSAAPPRKSQPQQQANQEIQKLYQALPQMQTSDVDARLEALTRYFLGRPYVLGSLGEGPKGRFDQSPLYRTDTFDCVTFSSTLIALAKSNSLQEFQKVIQKIRYKDAKVRFENRNHFMSVDWNPNNTHNGYIQDVTHKIIDKNGKPVAVVAETIINKPGWYQKFSEKQIQLNQPLAPVQMQQRLAALQALSKTQQQEKSVLLYIPLTVLFKSDGKANEALFQQIPTGSVVEIVRPDWDIKKHIGTNINVSHLGFAIRTQQGLRFRVASSKLNKIIDLPLQDYLRDVLDSPTIKGINILKVT